MNQLYLEPIMVEAALARSEITILFEHELVGFSQDPEKIIASVRSIDGTDIQIEAAFLAGCDGGNSMVRQAIGGEFHGDAVIQRVQSTYLRAPDLIAQMKVVRAGACFR